MFWVKKGIELFIMPLQFILLVAVVGTVLLWGRRWARSGKLLVTLAVVLLVVAANKQVGYTLIAPLEHRYPALPEFAGPADLPAKVAVCRYVVILGGGHADADELPSASKLSTSALARVVEGVRLWRLLPDATLITSGHGAAGHPDHSEILAEAAVSLGVPRSRILQMNEARDTADEAATLKRLTGGAPFVLVTSAWHMPRAMALCAGQGLAPVPAPTDFVLKGPRFQWGDLGWDQSGLDRTTIGVHEELGLLWTRLRGQD